MRKGLFLLLALFFAGLVCAQPVQIDFFYEPGCEDCERIEAELFPEIEQRFPDACVIRPHDIGIETNFLTLLQLENSIGHAGPERAYLIINQQHIFGSSPDRKELFSVISNLVGRGPRPRQNSAIMDRGYKTSEPSVVEERFSGFTLPAVIVAGLLDGLNPCAISTLVFFMSLLAVSTRRRQPASPRLRRSRGYGGQEVRNRQLILLGFSFCLASFLTYLALGFGLLRVLHLFSGFTVLRSAVEWAMAAVLLALAFFSFRDAFRFRKSRDGHDVTLQLSDKMKKRIHRVMHRGLGVGSVVLGGVLIGTAVTALESVCTGQVYVPTLVLILKDNALQGRAWLYLLAYNLMFILPLALTFVAVYFGLRTETLLAWSKKNVVLSKMLLGLFFIAMAVLIRLI